MLNCNQHFNRQIQPLEEITVAKSKGSLRAQIIAEEEIRFGEEIEAEEVVEEGDVIEGEELDEEGGEEEEGIDYADELPEFDEEAYYEGVVRTITGHFESLGLNVETELKINTKRSTEN